MKTAALRVFGWLALLGGGFRAFYIVGNAPNFSTLDTPLPMWFFSAMLYLILGIAVWALFTTVADIADRLNRPAESAAMVPPK